MIKNSGMARSASWPEELTSGQTTAREILTRLAAEGLVLAEGQRGFTVMPASLADLIDITETRRLIECHAARLSVVRPDLEWESRLVAAYHKLSKAEELVVKEADKHAAVGGPADRGEQQHAGHVLAPDVVLEIERTFGGIRQQHAGCECIATVAQLDDAGLPRVKPRTGRDRAAEPGLGGGRRLGQGFEHLESMPETPASLQSLQEGNQILLLGDCTRIRHPQYGGGIA